MSSDETTHRDAGMTPLQARAIVGKQADDDYVLDPTAHAEQYAEAAPGLAAALSTARLSTIAQQYKDRDQRAGDAQKRYQQTLGRANAAVLATAVLSAAMMAVQIVYPSAWWLVAACGVGSALCGALATKWLYQVRQGNLLERWMSARASAETARLSYFAALAEPQEAPPDPALDLLKLEYFCRHQYQVQCNYYRRRGRQHEQAANRNLSIGSEAVLLSAGAAGVSGFLGASAGGMAAALGAVGVLGAALSSYASAREAAAQNERNAERYARTQAALENLGGERLDRVRAAVAKGNAPALAEFVAAVNEQISLEHRQWLEGSEATKAAVAKLEDTLRDKPVEKPK